MHVLQILLSFPFPSYPEVNGTLNNFAVIDVKHLNDKINGFQSVVNHRSRLELNMDSKWNKVSAIKLMVLNVILFLQKQIFEVYFHGLWIDIVLIENDTRYVISYTRHSANRHTHTHAH